MTVELLLRILMAQNYSFLLTSTRGNSSLSNGGET